MTKKTTKTKAKVTHRKSKTGKPVTDIKRATTKPKKVEVIYTDNDSMTYSHMKHALDTYYRSNYFHNLDTVKERLDSGIPMSKLEQDCMDLIIEKYNLLYKSSLAKVMQE